MDNPAQIVAKTLRQVRPGSIILLHDGLQDGPYAKRWQARQGTMAALPRIITELHQRGYRFVRVEDL